MKTEKFLQWSAELRRRLDKLAEEAYDVADAHAKQETGHTVEHAAGCVAAAVRLLEMAEVACDDKEYVP